MNYKYIILFLFIIKCTFNFSIFGETNYFDISSIGSSADSISIAGVSGFEKSSSSIFSNPASLSKVNRLSFSSFKTTIFEDAKFMNASIANRVSSWGVVSFGYMELGVGNIPVTALDDLTKKYIAIDHVHYKTQLLKLGLSRRLIGNISLGVSGNYHLNKLSIEDAKGYSIDLGLLAQFKRYDMSFFVKNITAQSVEFETFSSEKIRQSYTVGLGTKFETLNLFAETTYKNNDLLYGFALRYSPRFFPVLNLSLGYKKIDVLDKKDYTFTGGLGMLLPSLKLNYAIERSDRIFNKYRHYFSFSLDL